VEREAPWSLVQWALAAFAAPDVRIRRFRFELADARAEVLPLVLPTDNALAPGEEGREAPDGLRVTLRREAKGAPLAIRVENLGPGGGEILWRPDQLDLRLSDALLGVRGERTDLTVAIRAAQPALVAAEEVHRTVAACHRAGIHPERIVFEGSPPR
jgi:hypothetical protein